MPIVVSSAEFDAGLYDRLSAAGAAVLTERQAEQQDIRPARIALLNLMPAAAMERTETQWLRYISHSILQIEPVLVRFDNDPRQHDGASRAETLNRYTPFSQVVSDGIDGLIVTGDNLELRNKTGENPELLPFDEINYSDQLAEVIDWSRSNVRSTIYSCLASHFALHHLYGLEREVIERKIFGVYKHEINRDVPSKLTLGMDDKIRAPHSRWGDIAVASLGKTAVQLLAVSESVGWLLAQDANNSGGHDVYIQGHPEYDRNDLAHEHERDTELDEPADYYADDKTPRLTWANDARALHANWINSLYQYFSDAS